MNAQDARASAAQRAVWPFTMPLIMMCGLPCTGKTTVAAALAEELIARGWDVNLINEESLALAKSAAYADASAEKVTRGTLRSAVERSMTHDSIILCDSLNYIKGYRYELYCLAREVATPHCVVCVSASDSCSSRWDAARAADERYGEERLVDLRSRFEAPSERQRWDSPLFAIDVSDDGDDAAGKKEEEADEVEVKNSCAWPAVAQAVARLAVDVQAAMTRKRRQHEHAATKPQRALHSDMLHSLDRVTKGVVDELLAAQAIGAPQLAVPSAGKELTVGDVISRKALRRMRKEFLKLRSACPPEDGETELTLAVSFLDYLAVTCGGVLSDVGGED